MLKHALRRLRRAPAFTLTAVLLLGLSIAAAASIGGLLQAVLLRPLPFRDPDRLVWVWASRVDRDKAFFSIPELLDHLAATRSADLIACSQWGATLTGDGEPERIPAVRMAANGLTLLGIAPAAGRVFDASDEQRKVAVISHDLWRRRFGADPRALGKTLALNGEPYEIVGVLPVSWTFPNLEAQVWVPFDFRADPRRAQRGNNFIRAFGRLRPGGTSWSLQAEMKATQQRLKEQYAEAVKTAPPHVHAFADELLGAVRRPMWPADVRQLEEMLGAALAPRRFQAFVMLLFAGAALVLAATGLYGLTAWSVAQRQREIGVRLALGATAAGVTRMVVGEGIASRWPVCCSERPCRSRSPGRFPRSCPARAWTRASLRWRRSPWSA